MRPHGIVYIDCLGLYLAYCVGMFLLFSYFTVHFWHISMHNRNKAYIIEIVHAFRATLIYSATFACVFESFGWIVSLIHKSLGALGDHHCQSMETRYWRSIVIPMGRTSDFHAR
jgi:hypothetical protein